MKLTKKILKGLLFLMLILVVIVGGLFVFLHESRPEGVAGPEAEAMADKMLEAVHAEKWDRMGAIAFEFPRGHRFVWDKKNHQVEVKWDENRALLAPNDGRAVIFEKGERVTGSEAEKLKETAYQLFYNDSFWLLAFTKVKDPGTTRQVVDLEEEGKGLLVTFSTGGITPGDAYLWKLDESGRPISWKMWVQIIPVGGLEFTWEDWQELPNGAWVARNHKNFLFDVELKNIKAGNSLKDIGYPSDLFSELNER